VFQLILPFQLDLPFEGADQARCAQGLGRVRRARVRGKGRVVTDAAQATASGVRGEARVLSTALVEAD
jgi:hypothetical protein